MTRIVCWARIAGSVPLETEYQLGWKHSSIGKVEALHQDLDVYIKTSGLLLI